MTVSLRPLDPTTDFPRIAELHNTAEPLPITAEQLHKWEQDRPEGTVSRRSVAVDAAELVGYVDIAHMPWDAPGRFWLDLVVDPARMGQGIGTQLYDAAWAFAQEHGVSRIKSGIRDNCPGCLRFAERRGYTIDRHIFDSTLEVLSFDETPYAGTVEAVEQSGIRFFSLGDLDVDEAVERQLYTLNIGVAQDIPGWDDPPPPFEEFRKWVFTTEHYRPDGQIIAADGDRWVGMAALGHYRELDSAVNMMTGVERDYRGRKIALALKLLANRTARRWGVKSILTNNDSQNAPMLAINRKLGYQPDPGKYILKWSAQT